MVVPRVCALEIVLRNQNLLVFRRCNRLIDWIVSWYAWMFVIIEIVWESTSGRSSSRSSWRG